MQKIRPEGAIAVAIFSVSFAVYWATAARLPVNIADSNELMTAAFTNGVAHPPAYPLYTTMLRLAMNLAPHNPAFGASLTAVVFQSLGVMLLFLINLALIKTVKINASLPARLAAAGSGALLLAFSGFFWDQATFAEVFSLTNLLTGLLILLIITQPLSSLTWIVFGLAAGHHQTALFLLPGYLYLLWPKRHHLNLVKSGIAFVTAFMVPYVWLLLTADSTAAISWQYEPTPLGFLRLIGRSVYTNSAIETYTNSIDLRHSLISIFTWGSNLIEHVTLPVMLLSLIGLWQLYSRSRRLFWALGISLLLSGPALAAYLKFPMLGSVTDIQYAHGTYLRLRMFSVFEYLCLVPVSLAGLFFLTSRRTLIRLVFIGIGLLPGWLLYTHWPTVDKRIVNFDQLFYTKILTDIPDQAIILADSDMVFGLLYQQSVNHLRPDVLIIPTAAHMRWGYLHAWLPKTVLDPPGYYRFILSAADWALATKRPLFVLDPSANFINQMKHYRYRLSPAGYTLRISTTPVPIEPYDYGLTYQLGNYAAPDDLWSRGDMAALSVIHLNLAYSYDPVNPGIAAIHHKLAEKLNRNPINYAKYQQIYTDQP